MQRKSSARVGNVDSERGLGRVYVKRDAKRVCNVYNFYVISPKIVPEVLNGYHCGASRVRNQLLQLLENSQICFEFNRLEARTVIVKFPESSPE